jgi:hypothetical protein
LLEHCIKFMNIVILISNFKFRWNIILYMFV